MRTRVRFTRPVFHNVDTIKQGTIPVDQLWVERGKCRVEGKRQIRTAKIEHKVSEKRDRRGHARSCERDETREGDGDDDDRVGHLDVESPMSEWELISDGVVDGEDGTSGDPPFGTEKKKTKGIEGDARDA